MQLRRGCSGVWIALAAAVADRISKALVMQAPVGAPVELLPGVARVRHAANTGVAFSLLSGGGFAIIALTAVLVAGLSAWLLLRPEGQSRMLRVGLWLVVGGGIGNLYDRIAYGYVIDFIELTFVRFAVFNVADVAICAGAAVAAVALILDERRKESSHG